MSCQVQERKFRSGFYVSGKQGQAKPTLKISESPVKILTGKNRSVPATAFFKTQKKQNPDSCDLLTFYDGTQIKARIITTNGSEIKYRYCDGDNKIRTARRASVLSIVHAGAGGNENTKSSENHPPVNTPIKKTEISVPDTIAVTSTTLPPLPVDSTKKSGLVNCDKIIFRNGTEEMVKVVEIGVSEIRYHACDMPDGPLFIKKKSETFMIVFPDGSREVFKEEQIETLSSQATELETYQPQVKTKSSLAVIAFISSLAGIFPLYIAGCIAAIIMGVIYLNKAQKEPQVYISTTFARVAIVISVIVLAVSDFFLIKRGPSGISLIILL